MRMGVNDAILKKKQILTFNRTNSRLGPKFLKIKVELEFSQKRKKGVGNYPLKFRKFVIISYNLYVGIC